MAYKLPGIYLCGLYFERVGMPLIQVSILKGRTAEQKRMLLGALTDAVVASVGGSPNSVRVIINEIEPSNWSVAGAPFSERDI